MEEEQTFESEKLYMRGMAQLRAAQWKAAVETLIAMIERRQPGSEIHIPTELVRRGSAGRPPALARAAVLTSSPSEISGSAD